MQFVFASFEIERQKRIVRLMLGLSPEGHEVYAPIIDTKVCLMTPYLLISLLEVLHNVTKISQAKTLLVEMVTHLRDYELVLVGFLDKPFVSEVLSPSWLSEFTEAN